MEIEKDTLILDTIRAKQKSYSIQETARRIAKKVNAIEKRAREKMNHAINCGLCGKRYHPSVFYTAPVELDNPDPTIWAKYEEKYQMMEVVKSVHVETGEIVDCPYTSVCRRCFVNYRDRPHEERISSTQIYLGRMGRVNYKI
jgi:hypothetical protein